MTEVRTLLEARLAELEARQQRIEDHLRHKGGLPTADAPDRAAEMQPDEVLDGLDGETRAQVAQIRLALARLEAGEYGNCVVCGEPIAPGRLLAIPDATRCIDCARQGTPGRIG